jgi:hypothetical protein
MSDNRLPREDIPASLTCKVCGFGPAKNESGFRNHMAAKHNIKYERDPATKALDKLRSQKSRVKEYKETSELLPWHMVALAKHVTYGASYKAIGKDMGRSAAQIGAVASSEAGQKYMEELREQISNPKLMVRNLMEASSLKVFADAMVALEWAKESKDYAAIHRFAKDIGLKSILDQDKEQMTAAVVQINLGSNDLASVPIETSYEVVSSLDDDDDDGP